MEDSIEELFRVWEDRFFKELGPLHPRVRDQCEAFLRCGDLGPTPWVPPASCDSAASAAKIGWSPSLAKLAGFVPPVQRNAL